MAFDEKKAAPAENGSTGGGAEQLESYPPEKQEPSVKLSRICKSYGVILRSYEAGEPLIRELGLLAQCEASDGFAV